MRGENGVVVTAFFKSEMRSGRSATAELQALH